MAKAATLDFTNVKEGSQFTKKHKPEGDYLARVTKVDDAEAKSDNVSMWVFTIELDADKRATYGYYCKLTENQLWKVRNLFQAAGLPIPKKRTKVDPNRVVGRPIAVTLEDEEYNDKVQSNIAAVFPPSELTDAEPEDPADGDDADEPEDTEEVDTDDEESGDEEAGDDLDDLDRTALKAVMRELGMANAKKSQSDDDLRELIRVERGADVTEQGDDEDEEEEEEPPPPPKKAKKAKKAKAVTPEDLEELDVDEV
jgi:hypothetical protein